MPCRGRRISLPSFRAENLHRTRRRWRSRGGASPGPALPGLLVQVVLGLRSRRAAPRAGTAPAASLAHPWLGESLLLPRLSSSGPTPVSQRNGGANCLAHGCAACRRLSGVAHHSPRARPAGSSCLGEIGGSSRCRLGARPPLHPGTRTFPWTTEAALL